MALERSLWEALAEGPILKLSFEASAAKKGVTTSCNVGGSTLIADLLNRVAPTNLNRGRE